MKKLVKGSFLNSISIVLLLVTAVSFFYSNKNKEKQGLAEFQKLILSKDSKANELMQLLTPQNDTVTSSQLFNNLSKGNYDSYLKEDIHFFRYRNDTLRFWSSNQIPVENYLQTICLDNPVVKLKNGWYRVLQSPKKVKQLFILYPIKKNYFIQNQYLENSFPFYPLFSNVTEVSLNKIGGNIILDTNGKFLFSLNNLTFTVNQQLNYLVFILLLFAFTFLLIGQFNRAIESKNKIHYFFILFFLMSCLRIAMLVFKWPLFIYDLPLFSPIIFANSYLNASLGDVLLNTVYITIIVAYLRVHVVALRVEINNSKFSLLYSILALFFHVGLTLFSIEIVPSLIKDSTLNFDPTNIISFDSLTWVGLIIIAFLSIIYFLWVDLFFKLLWNKNKLLFLFTLLGVGILVYTQNRQVYLYAISFFISTHLFFLLVNFFRKKIFTLPIIIIGIVYVAFLFSFVIFNQLKVKQRDELRLLADNFSEERDPIAEYLFNDLSSKIEKDTLLHWQITKFTNKEEAYNRLISNYFSGYWDKYNVKVIVYDSLCNTILKPTNLIEDRLLFFQEIEKNHVSIAQQASFYPFLSSGDLSRAYLGKISKKDSLARLLYTIYIELKPKLNYAEFGFPSLLLEKKISNNQIDFPDFSYAKYQQGKLVSSLGNANYPTNLSNYNTTNLSNDFFIHDGFIHVTKKINNKNSIVISKVAITMNELLNLFSYWFILLLLASFLAFMVHQVYNKFNLFTNHLRNRIQALLVTTITIIFVLVGWWNVSFIKTEYANKNNSYLNEKTTSIVLELQSKLGEENTLNFSSNEYLNYLLSKFSNIFYTDLNLFNSKGNLISTSRSPVYDNGLISKKIDPITYKKIVLDSESKFIHSETIGKLVYTSAYVPFFNKDGNLLAYLNLPYFSKQSVLETEISVVLISLLNIYVLCFVFSFIISVFISNRIVLPLKILQTKLMGFQFNKQNEAIVWKANDEIGALITEYNKMISELASSAEKLTKSEREGAWREMAKQVAHEIKNPLTPMKLNIQQFQRTWMHTSNDEKQKVLDKFSSAMIEQIDTLSSIASTFSDFAQLPQTRFTEINLTNLIKDVGHIFGSSYKGEIIISGEESIFINGDKEQLIRVFNNLVKNAFQSIPEFVVPSIKIDIRSNESYVLITVTDNGVGISEEIKNKIFMPNFTTKSNGMGLGLAMVKNTIEAHSGTISFYNNLPSGTVFLIKLPLASTKIC